MAIKSLPARSCLIDGEAIVCDETGLAVFEPIRAIAHTRAQFFARSTCLSSTATCSWAGLLALISCPAAFGG